MCMDATENAQAMTTDILTIQDGELCDDYVEIQKQNNTRMY